MNDNKDPVSIMTTQLQKIYTSVFSVLIFSLIFLASCGTDSDTSMGSMQIRMHDAPIDSADAVNVSVKRVEINKSGSEGGWSVISSPNQTYNLLELTNGAYEVLGDTTLPTGRYQQIRLVLNETGHSVVVDGQTHNMVVPSGTQTGIKLNVDAQIEQNIQYVLLLDFDAASSVVQAGNQQSDARYLLKPVIKAKNKAVTGAIAGTVSPAEARPTIYAIQNSDTLTATIADTSSGEFELIGLEEGTYDVSIDPRNNNYQTTDTTNVEVTIGETNDLGTIEVTQESVL